jgi:hypothetical protein
VSSEYYSTYLELIRERLLSTGSSGFGGGSSSGGGFGGTRGQSGYGNRAAAGGGGSSSPGGGDPASGGGGAGGRPSVIVPSNVQVVTVDRFHGTIVPNYVRYGKEAPLSGIYSLVDYTTWVPGYYYLVSCNWYYPGGAPQRTAGYFHHADAISLDTMGVAQLSLRRQTLYMQSPPAGRYVYMGSLYIDNSMPNVFPLSNTDDFNRLYYVETTIDGIYYVTGLGQPTDDIGIAQPDGSITPPQPPWNWPNFDIDLPDFNFDIEFPPFPDINIEFPEIDIPVYDEQFAAIIHLLDVIARTANFQLNTLSHLSGFLSGSLEAINASVGSLHASLGLLNRTNSAGFANVVAALNAMGYNLDSSLHRVNSRLYDITLWLEAMYHGVGDVYDRVDDVYYAVDDLEVLLAMNVLAVDEANARLDMVIDLLMYIFCILFFFLIFWIIKVVLEFWHAVLVQPWL